MGIHHNMGREMLEQGTSSHHNRNGNMIDIHQRSMTVLANSHQCATMLLIRPTVSLCRRLGKPRLHNRLTPTKHKVGNLLVALPYPLKWRLRLRL